MLHAWGHRTSAFPSSCNGDTLLRLLCACVRPFVCTRVGGCTWYVDGRVSRGHAYLRQMLRRITTTGTLSGVSRTVDDRLSHSYGTLSVLFGTLRYSTVSYASPRASRYHWSLLTVCYSIVDGVHNCACSRDGAMMQAAKSNRPLNSVFCQS